MTLLDPITFVERLRTTFTKELEATGQYNKAGMQLAFERAIAAVLLQYISEQAPR